MCESLAQSYTWRIHAMSALFRLTRVYSREKHSVYTPMGHGELLPQHNIVPPASVDVIPHSDAGGFQLVKMRWSLVPSWWDKELSGVPATFTAQIDKIDTSPIFRDAYIKRRCIIPASGFFLRAKRGQRNQPLHFTSSDGKILAFAGLWDSWKNPETSEVIESCTIITGSPNEWTLKFHDRAPAMLDEAHFHDWMSCKVGIEILTIAPIDSLRQWEVSPRMNTTGVGDDDPNTIEPIE
jgi:putative SOS response-associated peptidase YedK